MKITVNKNIKDLDSYLGKKCILKYMLNKQYEIEIEFPLGWKMEDIPKILAETFIEKPLTVHIISIKSHNNTNDESS